MVEPESRQQTETWSQTLLLFVSSVFKALSL